MYINCWEFKTHFLFLIWQENKCNVRVSVLPLTKLNDMWKTYLWLKTFRPGWLVWAGKSWRLENLGCIVWQITYDRNWNTQHMNFNGSHLCDNWNLCLSFWNWEKQRAKLIRGENAIDLPKQKTGSSTSQQCFGIAQKWTIWVLNRRATVAWDCRLSSLNWRSGGTGFGIIHNWNSSLWMNCLWWGGMAAKDYNHLFKLLIIGDSS